MIQCFPLQFIFSVKENLTVIILMILQNNKKQKKEKNKKLTLIGH